MAQPTPSSVDDYIGGFPKEVQAILESVRRTVQKAVPGAEEGISYKMPGFWLHGAPLLYYAAYRKHYSLFGVERFKEELSRYEGTTGTIRFPLDEPVPVKLIGEIARHQAKKGKARTPKKAG
jgi:uncharacterized protein YdhG (YjbR/CyaY superfamily)